MLEIKSVRKMYQEAEYPEILESLVNRMSYREGWTFTLHDRYDRGQRSSGLTFTAVGTYPDTYTPENIIRVAHLFPVPPAAYDERSWRRWIFERILEIERHEAMEFFKIDDKRPYAPHHGPGNDPYIIFEHGTDLDVRTSFRGEISEV